MYTPRTKNYSKKDMAMRWALPDRVFFACGACHILAYAFLDRWGGPEAHAVWIKPAEGHTGNHIFVDLHDGSGRAFDYHGYADTDRLIEHYWKRARQTHPGWDATLHGLPADVLISEAKSRTYDGLWLREPGQFLHDALPRAHRYLDRIGPPAR